MKIKSLFINLNSFMKGFVLFLRPGLYFRFLSNPFQFFANLLKLSHWIIRNNRKDMLNDFYLPVRNYVKRYDLYEYVLKKENLREKPVNYLEFGVFGGFSFHWWVNNCKNKDSRFYGFDTFEGLPEDWGTYKRGDMNANIPQVNDSRHLFIKGLFQDTLFNFLKEHEISGKKLILHMDADLFSSTLFVLTTLAPYLKEGDIIMFDEFNVPNHEFYAFDIFVKSFYIKYELIASVNNFYQIALKITK